ncbi:hypothetical protein [Rugamonas sp. DEMB1]|uniref:hypothetical protein n=1 Tax=Rugamonas sp. DEMB1 TaxID=3039386 RepID=UPI002449168F|nr:hypothetical protein [Rugamonas sp. DEMB1]WGG53199.1 hypothetical protein QC826_14460 [Rugamonas sp. DEMB1]
MKKIKEEQLRHIFGGIRGGFTSVQSPSPNRPTAPLVEYPPYGGCFPTLFHPTYPMNISLPDLDMREWGDPLPSAV